MIDLLAWLRTVEWYDNHAIGQILSCHRKAYWHLLYRGGLADTVGPGADFGTCIHAGLAVYYSGWATLPETKRRYGAFQAFERSYERLFVRPGRQVQNKHTLDNGIDILDEYFDQFLIQDRVWKPIENELAAIYQITPREGDPPGFAVPFWYLIRVDGVWERVSTGEWYVFETKTTGSGVDRELTRLRINRQTTGYAAVLSEFPDGRRIVGVIPNIILVAAGKREAKRDVMHRRQIHFDSWRHQTIHIIEDWRRSQALAAGRSHAEALEVFYQNDQHCTNYGLCTFYDCCDTGRTGLRREETMPLNTWTPLNSLAGEES